jgi:hypothetical protein
VIVILGLLEMHSFQTGTRGLELLAQGADGVEFRLPITEEQAVILLSHVSAGEEEDTGDARAQFVPSPALSTGDGVGDDDDGDPPPLMLQSRSYRMGVPARPVESDNL